MFTICFAVYASLVSVSPEQSLCFKAPPTFVSAAVSKCEQLSHDPLSTCEAREVGANRWYVTVRRMTGGN